MPSRASGVSLVECVLASFLLLTSVLMSVWLFDASLKAEVANDKRLLATMVAQNKLEEIRDYAANRFGEGFSRYDNTRVSGPEELEIITRVAAKRVFTPCSQLESQYPLNPTYPAQGAKAFERSLWQVEVDVQWSPRAGDRVTLTSYVADAREPNYTLSIDPSTPQTVAARATRAFRVIATDPAGDALPDLMYSWYVNPLSGMGTISEVSRDGDRCTYRNHFRNFDGTFKVMAGDCEVEVRAVYRGVERTAKVRVTNEP